MKAPLKLTLLLFVAFLWNSSKAQDTLFTSYGDYWYTKNPSYDFHYYVLKESIAQDTQKYLVFGEYDYDLHLVEGKAIRVDIRELEQPVLLYDFNLKLGDTFCLDTEDSLYTFRLMHLDTVSINGIMHARQYLKALNHNNNEVIIQGIGSVAGGLINYWYRYGNQNRKLFGCCYGEGEVQALIADSDSFKIGSCRDIDFTYNQDDVAEKMFLSPNPVSSILEIAGVRGRAIVVIDATGKMVLKEHDLNISSDAYQIDVGDLEPGLYYLKILNDSGFGYTGRFVKI